MAILGFVILMVMAILLLGWLLPLITGIVRLKKKTGGKTRLVIGSVWAILAVILIAGITGYGKKIARDFNPEEFNPSEYTGSLGQVKITHKGESSLTLYDTAGNKRIRFESSDGIFNVPPGNYAFLSWKAAVTVSDAVGAKWTASAGHYTPSFYAYEGKVFSVKANSTVELDEPVFKCFDETPELKITTKTDTKKKGNTGIGLDITAAKCDIKYRKEDKPLEAKIEITSEDGTVVHKDTAGMDKFVFG